jgi:hypothetical protein
MSIFCTPSSDNSVNDCWFVGFASETVDFANESVDFVLKVVCFVFQYVYKISC